MTYQIHDFFNFLYYANLYEFNKLAD